MSLHFEHVHSSHPNHCRHPIHHILRSLSSYNLMLELTIFTLEPSFFVKISSLVTSFKFSWHLLSVVVPLLGLLIVFISLAFLEIGCHGLHHFDFRLGRLNFCSNQSRPIGFQLNQLPFGSGSTDGLPAESAFAWFYFHSDQNFSRSSSIRTNFQFYLPCHLLPSLRSHIGSQRQPSKYLELVLGKSQPGNLPLTRAYPSLPQCCYSHWLQLLLPHHHLPSLGSYIG